MKNFMYLILTALWTNNVRAQIIDVDDFNINELGAIIISNNLNQINIDEICKVVNSSLRDDICINQLKIVCENATFRERMLDANSKFPYTGMLVKTRLDLGSYDECIGLDLTRNDVRVLGKHCTGGIVIPNTLLNDSNNAFEVEQAYKLSSCIPDKCTAMDLLELFNSSNLFPLLNDMYCSTKDSYKLLEWDDYAVIAFFTLVLLVMIMSTIYDLYFYYIDPTGRQNVLLQAFSMFHNGQKLLKVSKGSHDEIKVIHGLKVITMMWIVFAHTFSTMTSNPGSNVDFALKFEWTRKSTYVTTGYLGVDTFFFLSGFLLAYQYLKQKPTSLLNHVKRVPLMVLHRYIRLTPVVASIFIITSSVLTHCGDGPIYRIITEVEQDKCIKHWLSYFTYTQNYVNYDDLCLVQTWYLSVDWQLFLISPVIFIPVAMLVKSNFKWIMGQLLILNLIFTFLPVAVKFLLRDYDNVFETHTRLNGYFIGFMLGVYMREKSDTKLRLNTKSNLLIWTIALSTIVIVTLTYKEIQLLVHSEEDKSYQTYFILLRCFWCSALGWIIYACHHGYGGFINWLLTTPLVQVLSKLTFCMYLIHLCPIFYIRATIRAPIELSQMTAFKDAIVGYMVSVVMAVMWTLAFESPIIAIEKYFLGRRN